MFPSANVQAISLLRRKHWFNSSREYKILYRYQATGLLLQGVLKLSHLHFLGYTNMSYHKLGYKKEINEIADDMIPSRRIVFDGKVTDYIFDEPALKVSSEKDGIYPIVVCDCDILGCGGMYVSTRIDGNDIVWEKFWHSQCTGKPDADEELRDFSLLRNSARGENLVIETPLRFERLEYEKVADQLIEVARLDTPDKYKQKGDWLLNTLERYRSGDTSRI